MQICDWGANLILKDLLVSVHLPALTRNKYPGYHLKNLRNSNYNSIKIKEMTEKSPYNWKGNELDKHFSGTCKQLAEEKGVRLLFHS